MSPVLFLSLAPSFRTPRPLGAHRQQGVLPSEGKGLSLGRNYTHKNFTESLLPGLAGLGGGFDIGKTRKKLFANTKRARLRCLRHKRHRAASTLLSLTMRKCAAARGRGKVRRRMRKAKYLTIDLYTSLSVKHDRSIAPITYTDNPEMGLLFLYFLYFLKFFI